MLDINHLAMEEIATFMIIMEVFRFQIELLYLRYISLLKWFRTYNKNLNRQKVQKLSILKDHYTIMLMDLVVILTFNQIMVAFQLIDTLI